MSLYAIGDLHLHFQSVLKAQNQLHDRVWKKHEEKFLRNCRKMVTEEDTLVLVGDHSWGRNLSECEQDLKYICDLPGRKILTRGNHDMFWDVKKTGQLNDLYRPRLTFLPTGITRWSARKASHLKDRSILTDGGGSSDGTRKPGRMRRSWWSGKCSGFGSLLSWQRRTDTVSSLCSCTIRPQIYWKSAALLRIWPGSMALNR